MGNSDYYGLSLDADLQPLLGKAGVTRRSCLCFGQWRRGFSEERIADFFGITVAEATADIETVMKQLPAKTLATDIELRNQIIAIGSRSQERQEQLRESLLRPAESYLQAGRRPVGALRRFREETCAEDPSLIAALRKQNNHASIDGTATDLAPEAACRIIAELRGKEKKPNQKVLTESHVRDKTVLGLPGKDRQTTYSQDQKPASNRTDRRVTFRMDPGLHEQLQKYSQDIGIDISTAIRMAVLKYLDGESASKGSANATMPAEALALTGPFQTWGSNIREELRLRFLKLLAMAYVAQGRWTRTKWVRELYLELLPLYRHLEVDDVRQPPK